MGGRGGGERERYCEDRQLTDVKLQKVDALGDMWVFHACFFLLPCGVQRRLLEAFLSVLLLLVGSAGTPAFHTSAFKAVCIFNPVLVSPFIPRGAPRQMA
jgi:hypothetical protein